MSDLISRQVDVTDTNVGDTISRQAAIDAVDKIHQEHLYKQIGDKDTYTPYNEGWADACDHIDSVLRGWPSADAGILHKLLAELTTKERTDRYHVWTTHEVKQWIADKITEMKNDG